MVSRRPNLDDPFTNFDASKRFGKVFFAVWVLWALICLTVAAAVVIVAVHFIAKFW